MKRFFIFLVCVLVIVETALAAEKPEAGNTEFAGVYSTLDELNGKRIGVQSGTGFETIIREKMPQSEIKFFQTKPDLIAALTGNKIDAFVIDNSVIQFMVDENSEYCIVPEFLSSFDFGFVFPDNRKGWALRKQFNDFLKDLVDQGLMNDLTAKWFGSDDSAKTMPDIESLSSKNGTLLLATESNYEPFEYVKDNKVVGFDMEIAARFCEANGYGLTIIDMNFDGILPSLTSGKCDFAGAGFNILDERKESVLFSDPYFTSGTVAVVLKSEKQVPKGNEIISGSNNPFINFMISARDSFEKTFIRENRWKLFIGGALNTLIITICSALGGTLLGFLMYMLYRRGNPVAISITDFSLWLVQGMPGVVLMMILYYIVFGKIYINSILVAIIGFTLTFGAAVIGMLKMGVGAVDNGQYEAARALGYNDLQTFFTIILPQALPHVAPSYKAEVMSLIKATAIVGYIAVQDLTRIGDIIRSRTYEAFFPLISVTIIYFILEAALGFLAGRIERLFNPRLRSRDEILKGVDTHGMIISVGKKTVPKDAPVKKQKG